MSSTCKLLWIPLAGFSEFPMIFADTTTVTIKYPTLGKATYKYSNQFATN